MTGVDSYRKGWCPGALRPMASGDGLIVRLRLSGGAITPVLGRAIAGWSTAFGNGLIDLTTRANLQLRGVRDETLVPLQAALAVRGLLDADPAAEAVRNVLASPLAGVDPSAVLDIRPIIRALEGRLRATPSLHRLPAKFGFSVDDGGRLPLDRDRVDVAFLARDDEGKARFDYFVGGVQAGTCAVDDLPEVAARLAEAFTELRGAGSQAPRRMAALVRQTGIEAILAAAGLTTSPRASESDPRVTLPPLGIHNLGACKALGIGIPFGRLRAEQLMAVSEAAAAIDGELRLTSWRALLIIGTRVDAALARRMHQAGFILDEDAPLRRVAACPGAPACRSGVTQAQTDGAYLASLARGLGQEGITLHVSGCPKGCAHPNAAAVTLVGRDGHYDIVFDGRASDRPAVEGMTTEAVAQVLRQLTVDAENNYTEGRR